MTICLRDIESNDALIEVKKITKSINPDNWRKNIKINIEPARMQNCDYGWCGKYYITICTRGKEFYFGEIAIAVRLSSMLKTKPRILAP